MGEYNVNFPDCGRFLRLRNSDIRKIGGQEGYVEIFRLHNRGAKVRFFSVNAKYCRLSVQIYYFCLPGPGAVKCSADPGPEFSLENMKRIGVSVAMERELRMLEGSLHLTPEKQPGGFVFHVGKYDEDHSVVIAQSGIGKVNSALCVASMIEHYGVEAIVSTGVCGTLCDDGSIAQKDIICASSVRYHDVWCGPENLSGQVQGEPQDYPCVGGEALRERIAAAYGHGVKLGGIASGDWFVDTEQKARSIAEACPEAIGVDMESASIAHTCRRYGVPFVSVRMVSDAPLCADAVSYVDFWETAPSGLGTVLGAVIGYLIA